MSPTALGTWYEWRETATCRWYTTAGGLAGPPVPHAAVPSTQTARPTRTLLHTSDPPFTVDCEQQRASQWNRPRQCRGPGRGGMVQFGAMAGRASRPMMILVVLVTTVMTSCQMSLGRAQPATP